jgi:ribosomal protein L40E
MSSATSIKGKAGARPKPAAPTPSPSADRVDDSFRPWHFFVLMSLAASTVAVVMARESTPENLVLLSFTIGAAGLAAGALYRALAPLVANDVTVFSEPLTDRLRATLEREKALVLRAIKELEFDRAMGKLSSRDFEEMSGKLRARAITLIQQLDEGGAGYREMIERELSARLAGSRSGLTSLKPEQRVEPELVPSQDEEAQSRSIAAGTCRACGSPNDADAVFCKRCGARIGESSLTSAGHMR